MPQETCAAPYWQQADIFPLSLCTKHASPLRALAVQLTQLGLCSRLWDYSASWSLRRWCLRPPPATLKPLRRLALCSAWPHRPHTRVADS
jgi:hypothetical protein